MKPILVSGIQPSGRLHLGNYLGALKNFVDLQNSGEYRCYFFIADLHSLTEEYNPGEKTAQILELAANFLAAGIDPQKSLLFLQSQVSAHSELAWILNTLTPLGELYRMTQFKDKVARKETGAAHANAGLLTYPTLMAADILLYDAELVPVGDDQMQHLELTRALARRFNNRFGQIFAEPQGLLTPAPRVMSLGNPTKKMSKSIPESCLFLDDTPAEIEKKVKRAVTDSASEIQYDPERKPAVSNLLQICAALSDTSISHLEKKYRGKTYREFKVDLARLIIENFAPLRLRKAALLKKTSPLKIMLAAGSRRAKAQADKKMAAVKKKIGITV